MKYVPNNPPRLLVISHVLPIPRNSGQNMRLYNTLMALRQSFKVVFLTSETFMLHKQVEKEELEQLCDELIILPSVHKKGGIKHLLIRFSGLIFSLFSGLKFSNYLINNYEFTPNRIRIATENISFSIVLFEYWHAYKSVSVFKKLGIPCILDMHNILVQSYIIQYDRLLPSFIKKIHIQNYQRVEENSWKNFDAIITINKNELDYVRKNVPSHIKLFYMAMGIDLTVWPYVWQPIAPARLAYYGGMGAYHNKQNAFFCVKEIMPLVWQKFPEAEFWIIGSDPDSELLSLEKDSRIHVTGYQGNVQNVLKSISILLCPWHGKFGFRSRIIEVMASGVPVICSKDAVDGMELKEGEGLFFAENGHEFANSVINLLSDDALLKHQSRQARKQVEAIYSFENTYQSGIAEIRNWLLNK